MRNMRRIMTFIWATALTTSVVGGTTLAAWAASGGGGAATQPASTSTKQKVVIRFWNWWDTYRKEWMDEVIRRFEAEYPWIDVRNEVQGWADRSAKVMAAYAAGAPAEITMALRQEIAALSDMGAIIPITQFVQRDKMDLKEFFAAEVQAFIWDDELWSLPLPSVSGEGSMYFYNKSLFEEAGLDPDHPPVTWRTFQQAAKKLTRADAQGRLTQLAIDTHPPMVVHMTYANAGQIITDDRRRAVFDSQQAIDALKFVAIDLNQKALGGPAAIDAFRAGTTPAGPFVQGKQAMISGHPSVIGVILDQAPKNFNWGVMPAPYNENNPNSKSRGIAGFQWGWGYAIPKGLSPEKQEAAWLFLKFLTADERGAGYFMLQQGRPASVRQFNLNPEYMKKIGNNWPLIIKYLGDDVAFPVLPVHMDIYNTVINGLYAPLGGSIEPENALKNINSQVQTILDNYWAKRPASGARK